MFMIAKMYHICNICQYLLWIMLDDVCFYYCLARSIFVEYMLIFCSNNAVCYQVFTR